LRTKNQSRKRPVRAALIQCNATVVKAAYRATMKISDFNCPFCASSYEVAESQSATGSPGRVQCTVCGKVLDSWQQPRLKAYRLVLAPEHKYPRIPTPPSPGLNRPL
jgi:predicted Zn finger-like uncharacterized protein